MKRLTAAAALLALILTNCKKEETFLAVPETRPAEPIEVTYRDTPRPTVTAIAFEKEAEATLEIRTATCFAGGTTLEVALPGLDPDRFDSRRFTIEWAVDGERAGDGPRLECAEGKQAEVTVTVAATGELLRATADLEAGSDR